MSTKEIKEDPESVRELAKMLLKEPKTEQNKSLLLLCGIAISDTQMVAQACQMGAKPSGPVSEVNINIMQQFGYFTNQ